MSLPSLDPATAPVGAEPTRSRPRPLEGPHLVWWHWLLLAAWAALPFTTGTQLAAALAGDDRAVRWVVVAIAWVWWGIGLLACLVPRPIGLVVLRVGAATAGAAALWSLGRPLATTTWVGGLAGAAIAVVVTFAAETGLVCVNGRSYPNERRYLLRPARVLYFGPIALTAVVLGGGVFAGPVLLARQRWVLGPALLVAGWLCALVATRALYALTSRFVVFVPAGFVVHDGEALRDTVLFKRGGVETIRLAAPASEALDLTHGAPGRRVEVLLHDKTEVTRVANSWDTGETGKTAMFLFTPTRPQWVLRTAAARGYRTS